MQPPEVCFMCALQPPRACRRPGAAVFSAVRCQAFCQWFHALPVSSLGAGKARPEEQVMQLRFCVRGWCRFCGTEEKVEGSIPQVRDSRMLFGIDPEEVGQGVEAFKSNGNVMAHLAGKGPF